MLPEKVFFHQISRKLRIVPLKLPGKLEANRRNDNEAVLNRNGSQLDKACLMRTAFFESHPCEQCFFYVELKVAYAEVVVWNCLRRWLRKVFLFACKSEESQQICVRKSASARIIIRGYAKCL